MKKFLSANQLAYGILGLCYTVGFYYLLNYAGDMRKTELILPLQIGYGLIMAITAIICSKTDNPERLRFNVGFTYHFLTYIVNVPVTLIWALFFIEGQLGWVAWYIAGWTVGLITHYIAVSKNTVRGMNKKKVFK